MAPALPRGVSALLDPDDEPYLRILIACSIVRAQVGLPAWTCDELRALFDDEARSAPAGNVIVFPRRAVIGRNLGLERAAESDYKRKR